MTFGAYGPHRLGPVLPLSRQHRPKPYSINRFDAKENIIMNYSKDDERARTGWARMRAIAAEDQAQIRELVAGLLQGLRRPATTADLVAAENIAATTVKARRKRMQGKDDSAERRSIATLIRDFLATEQLAEPSTERTAEHIGV
jgi:hypothetical protein